MLYFTTVKISANRELTPDNYLLCKNVPLARTGIQLYLPSEIGLEPGPDGIVRINRTPKEVFDPESIASINGKPITVDHPSEDVSPENWQQLSVGIVLNPRRGEGDQANLLLADLLITETTAIQQVMDSDEVQVSAGYDAAYIQTSPGAGEQNNIRFNHLALLPNSEGRCGSICSIGDKAPGVLDEQDHSRMKKTWKDRLLAAFKSRDEAAFESELENEPKTEDEAVEGEQPKPEDQPTEQPAPETQDEAEPTIADLCKRLDALEAQLAAMTKSQDEVEPAAEAAQAEAENAEAETEDKKSHDSAVQLILSRAEILSPGIQLPVRDAAADPKKFNDSLCALKRRALEAAYAAPATRDAVAPLLEGVDVNKLTCDALHATFVGASELVKQANNAKAAKSLDASPFVQATTFIDDLNRRNKEFWLARQ